MAPLLVPVLPLVIVSQESAGATSADQGMLPDPSLDTIKVVDPTLSDTFWELGATDKLGCTPIPERAATKSFEGEVPSAVRFALFAPSEVGEN